MANINKEQLCVILLNTLSPDNNVLKNATNQLKLLDQMPRFTALLLDIISDLSIANIGIRYTAIVHLKNLISEQWRKKVNSTISDQEKSQYKDILLNLLTVYDQSSGNIKISQHISIIISIIARVDYPKDWSNLFPVLFDLFVRGNNHHKLSSLITIKYVVNELASRRFAMEKTSFNKLSIDLFKLFSEYWENSTNQLLSLFELIQQQQQNNLQQITETINQQQISLELLLLVTKILRRVVVYGFTQYQENNDITIFFNNILKKLPLLYNLRNILLKQKQNNIVINVLEKFIILNQKIIIKAQEQLPLSFVSFLPTSLEYFSRQILNYQPLDVEINNEATERIIVQAILYLKGIVDCVSYQTELPDDDDEFATTTPQQDLVAKQQSGGSVSVTDMAQQYIARHFNINSLSEILKILVSNYLIITAQDMTDWNESPEEYLLKMDAESNQHDLKPCAYDLFIMLMKNYPDDGVKVVLEMVHYVTGLRCDDPQHPLTDQQVLLKESCYMTIGLGYYSLYDNVNFDKLFETVFLKELQSPDPRFKIITRRVCWLISYCVSKIPASQRLTILSILIQLLGHQDLVVAMTAADSLKAYVDDYTFELNEFQPYINESLTKLFGLFQRCQMVETKCNLLTVLGVMFIKLNENIKPYANGFMQLISSLWMNGEAEAQLKGTIVRDLTLFLQALNGNPSDYSYQFLLSVIEHSIQPNSEQAVYLLEDGLELLYTLICRVNQFSQPLFQLFPYLLAEMKHSVDNHEMCLKIMDAYIILGQAPLLTTYGNGIVESILSYIGDLRETATKFVMQPIERILQIHPIDGCVLLEPIFKKLYDLVMDEDEPELAIVQYFNIFARICVGNPNYLLVFLDKINQNNNSEKYSTFFDLWFDHIDSISNSDMRKLTAIALSNLLIVSRTEMLTFIPQIITTVVGLRGDIDPSTTSEFFDAYSSVDGFQLPECSAVEAQSKLIQKSDPLTVIDMSTYLLEKMNQSSQIHGQTQFQNAIQKIHPKVLELAFPASK